MTWKKYPPSILKKDSIGFYQKKIYSLGDTDIYADLTEWELNGVASYELDIQIPEEVSITGMTINAKCFTYGNLDFNLAEKHAKQIIRALIINK